MGVAAQNDRRMLAAEPAAHFGLGRESDAAILLRDQMLAFLQQRPNESSALDETRRRLGQLSYQIDLNTRKRT